MAAYPKGTLDKHPTASTMGPYPCPRHKSTPVSNPGAPAACGPLHTGITAGSQVNPPRRHRTMKHCETVAFLETKLVYLKGFREGRSGELLTAVDRKIAETRARLAAARELANPPWGQRTMKDTRIQCPYCRVRTWAKDYQSFMADHDRLDGRVCQKAKRDSMARCRDIVPAKTSGK